MHRSHNFRRRDAATATTTTTTATTTILFKPRQVLLATMKNTSNPNAAAAVANDSDVPPPSVSDSKRIILHSICDYLDRHGFSKSVKKLRSEAQIEADSGKSAFLDLEETCNEHLKINRVTSNDNKEKGEGKKQKRKKENLDDPQQVITSEKADTEFEEEDKSKSKRKKKDARIADDLSSKEIEATAEEKYPKKGKVSKDKTEDGRAFEKNKVPSEYEDNSKQQNLVESFGGLVGDAEKDMTPASEGKKRKKKNKKGEDSEAPEGEIKGDKKEDERTAVVNVEGRKLREGPTLVACTENGDATPSAKQSKKKSKRKKDESPIPDDNSADEDPPKKADLPTLEDKTNEKRASKKRKKLSSEENGNGHVEVKLENGGSDEVKRSMEHKSIPLPENADDEVSKGESSKISQSKGEKGKVSQPDLQTPSKKEADLILAKNGGDKSTEKNSAKQRSGSAEPTTLKAFQRVKPEEVVFTDERLQDNSYWAKDGADSGYGAKAQEILGQVKGRGFRHEKTKKKRGSYRGGQIDLQSHSVKFNYSDDE